MLSDPFTTERPLPPYLVSVGAVAAAVAVVAAVVAPAEAVAVVD